VVTLGIMLVGALLYQTHYIDKVIEGLRNELKAEITGLRGEIAQRFNIVEERFAGLRAEIKAEIGGLRGEITQRFNNVDARLDRIEHPVVRP
jgi:hypothetical protein